MRTAPAYEEDEVAASDAEFSLGLGALIGIFFGLALVCGVFFGFGYMMGHRPAAASFSSSAFGGPPKAAAVTISPKPSAQVPEQPSRVVVANAESQERRTTIPPSEHSAAPATPAQKVVPRLALEPGPALSAANSPVQGLMVQIAAVKNRRDAEALAEALRNSGFAPSIRTEPQDKLLHVQLGPFDNRDEAKTMRQKLSSDGYNAFIK